MRRLLLPSLAATLVALAGCHHAPEVSPSAGRLRLTTGEIDSMWNHALALYQKQDWRKAGTVLERVQLEMPVNDKRLPLARFYLGESRLGEKSNLQAVREFRRVAELRPDDLGARFYLGLSHLRLGKWSEALTHLEVAARHRLAKAGVYVDLALALERLGRLDDARHALEEALVKGGGQEPRVHLSLGVLALREGRFAEADAHFMEARPHYGTRPPAAVWFHSASLAAALSGQIEKAITLLTEGTGAHPHAAALLNNLAVALGTMGRSEEALHVVEAGLAQDPGLAPLHRNRGDLLLAQGNRDAALDAYLRAVKHHETLGPEVWARIGGLRAALGQPDEAVVAWERALQLDPTHAEVRERLAAARRER